MPAQQAAHNCQNLHVYTQEERLTSAHKGTSNMVYFALLPTAHLPAIALNIAQDNSMSTLTFRHSAMKAMSVHESVYSTTFTA